MKSDGNQDCIKLLSQKLNLRQTKFTSAIALFHIMMVVFTKNISKHVNVTKKLGRLGTGIPIAPVLLFELYLAINYSSMATSGEPSTWFPLG